jgi:HSP20 family protein
MSYSPPAPEPFAMVIAQSFHAGFSRFAATEAWAPSVNVYQLDDRLEVAVDLAGIERDRIDVRVEPGRLLIRGVRPAPEPPSDHETGAPMRILTMEIDYGPFARVLPIPEHVDLRRVQSAYREGVLWITLPLRRRR